MSTLQYHPLNWDQYSQYKEREYLKVRSFDIDILCYLLSIVTFPIFSKFLLWSVKLSSEGRSRNHQYKCKSKQKGYYYFSLSTHSSTFYTLLTLTDHHFYPRSIHSHPTKWISIGVNLAYNTIVLNGINPMPTFKGDFMTV